MKKILLYTMILISILTGLTDAADFFTETDQYSNLRLGNEYVVIVVNTDQNGQGRFAIETTGGAPFRTNDNNKPLVYGRPIPWTSYTTLWKNGEYHVFGGFTGRRAGREANYGEVIQSPQVKGNAISTISEFDSGIMVEQLLTIVKSSTTGLYDSVEIKYNVQNKGTERQKIGLRIMLDTMLGENDGAPFRFGEDAVTADQLYYQKQLPEFWLAFDSLSNPNVTSQGTFTAEQANPPDRVNLADWGSLADGVWDFDFNPGEDFLRKGEYEIDSAIAMYWTPEILEPGQEINYTTYYGLGGITIVPGLLSLGVTSPAEVTFDTPEKTFPIIAYIENTSEITAKNVRIQIKIDDALFVEHKTQSLGDIAPGGMAQVVWDVKSTAKALPEGVTYQVKVEADNTDPNQVERGISFAGPPALEVKINLKDELAVIKGKLEPNPFRIETVISNSGDSTLKGVTAELKTPPGLFGAKMEKLKRYVGNIAPGESVNITWQLKADYRIGGISLPVEVDVRAQHGYRVNKSYHNLKLPDLEPLLYMEMSELGEEEEGKRNYIRIDLMAANIKNEHPAEKFNFNLKYDPEFLQPILVHPGNFFIKDGRFLPWSQPEIKQNVITFAGSLPVDIPAGSLGSIFFRVNKPGKHSIEWESAELLDQANRQIEVRLRDYIFK